MHDNGEKIAYDLCKHASCTLGSLVAHRVVRAVTVHVKGFKALNFNRLIA